MSSDGHNQRLSNTEAHSLAHFKSNQWLGRLEEKINGGCLTNADKLGLCRVWRLENTLASSIIHTATDRVL